MYGLFIHHRTLRESLCNAVLRVLFRCQPVSPTSFTLFSSGTYRTQHTAKPNTEVRGMLCEYTLMYFDFTVVIVGHNVKQREERTFRITLNKTANYFIPCKSHSN